MVECRKYETSLYQKIDFERKINEYVKNENRCSRF